MKRGDLGCCALALAVLLGSSGCVTSTLRISPADPDRVTRSGAPVAYSLEGMNTGVYLFYFIPLWTGNPNRPNQRDYDILSHRIDDKAIYRMFAAANRRRRTGGVADVTVDTRASGWWGLGIVWKRSVHGRGLLISPDYSPRKKKR